MDLESFVRSTGGLMVGLGALLAGIVSMAKAVIDVRRKFSATRKENSKPSLIISILKMPIFDIGVLLSLASLGIFTTRASLPQPPLNVQLTTGAWDALSKAEYTTAFAKSKECIAIFEDQATREQELLINNGNPLPPVGTVSEDEAQVILSRGVLNDVAACYIIMGQALEKLDRITDAKNAYKEAVKFPYARVWDPRGWFWSPAELASARLFQLP